MSNHYLVVDDAAKAYVDCEKFLLVGGNEKGEPDALTEQPWETWLRIVNWGDDPPEKTDRYRLDRADARALYDFLVTSQWKARIVSLDSDDFEAIYEPWAKEQGQASYRCARVVGAEVAS